MTTALTRTSGSAFELTLNIPWNEIKVVYDKVFEELASEIEIEGFRKGKAPRDIVASKIDKSKIYGEVINQILPDSYAKALLEHGLKPVISPKVQIASAEEEKEWQFIASAAEKPEVDLKDYQKQISGLNAAGKIWKPGDETPQTNGQTKEEENGQRQKKISEIIDKLLEVCKIELPELLVESEVNRLLTQLIEDVRKAGLTYEQYLQSSSQTAEVVREKYRLQAESALKLEFILDAVANDLSVQVEQKDIDAVIDKEPDNSKKNALKEQSYLISSILRRENTITKLLQL